MNYLYQIVHLFICTKMENFGLTKKQTHLSTRDIKDRSDKQKLKTQFVEMRAYRHTDSS